MSSGINRRLEIFEASLKSGFRTAVFWPVFLLFLGAMLSPAVNAQGGSRCAAYSTGSKYINFSSSFKIGTMTTYDSEDCDNTIDSEDYLSFDDGLAYATDAATAESICVERGPYDNYRAFLWPYDGDNVWLCGPVDTNSDSQEGDSRGSGTSSQSGRSSRYNGSSRSGKPSMPMPSTGELLLKTDLRLSAVDGLSSGIQFQRLDARGVGIQEVVDMGVLDAVDVWGNIGGGYEVCFPRQGVIVFLDAATSPRTVTEVEQYISDGYTCAMMDRAGTLVLTGRAIEPETEPVETSVASTIVVELDGCEVTTTHYLNFRNAPAGNTIHFVLKPRTKLVAKARTNGWFNVKANDSDGWVSARYVITDGNCSLSRII